MARWEQDDFLPMNPITVVARCRRVEARVTLYAPELTREECTQIYGHLCYIDLMMDKLTERIRRTPEWQVRMALPPGDCSLAPLTSLDHERARHWRSPRAVVPYPRKRSSASPPSSPLTPMDASTGSGPTTPTATGSSGSKGSQSSRTASPAKPVTAAGAGTRSPSTPAIAPSAAPSSTSPGGRRASTRRTSTSAAGGTDPS